MTIEIVLLALASNVRPSSLVAVHALAHGRSPRRLMTAYVIAGLAFTLAAGVAVLGVFRGIALNSGTSRTQGIAEIAGGALTFALGAAVLLGRIPLGRVREASGGEDRWRLLRGHEITTRIAALAGPATHIPGLLYLIALDLIVSQEPGVPRELVQVAIYNVVWFALPLLVLALCIIDPAAARVGVQRLDLWTQAHARAIVATILLGLGVWLLVDGATTV